MHKFLLSFALLTIIFTNYLIAIDVIYDDAGRCLLLADDDGSIALDYNHDHLQTIIWRDGSGAILYLSRDDNQTESHGCSLQQDGDIDTVTLSTDDGHFTIGCYPPKREISPAYRCQHHSLWGDIKNTVNECLEAILPNSYLNLTGYYYHDIESHSYGDRELSPYVRVTLINGMNNTHHDLRNTLELLSSTHGDTTIHYVFHPTSGWTHDLFYCAAVKLGYVSPYAKYLAAHWRSLLQTMGEQGHIFHYAHSIGGADTYAAIGLMSLEEQKRIRVVTLGSPTFISTGNLESAENYSSRNDGVSLIFGCLTALFDGNDNVEFIGEPGLPPLSDHTLEPDGTYGNLLQTLGNRFLEYVNAEKN